jgi:hypothetical protein
MNEPLDDARSEMEQHTKVYNDVMYLGNGGWVGPALCLKFLLRKLRDKGILSDDEVGEMLNDVRSEVGKIQ